MGIRSKLVLCLLAVLVPLIGVGAFATHLVDVQMAERTTAALANTQRLEAARIEQILHGYASDARALANGPLLHNFAARDDSHHLKPLAKVASFITATPNSKAGDVLKDSASELPLQPLVTALQNKALMIGSSIVELRLIDVEGITLGQTMGFGWVPADSTLIERSMLNATTLFGNAYLDIDDHERLGLVTPIISAKDEVVGALVMESRLAPILSLVSKHEDVGVSIEAYLTQATSEGDAQFITPLRFDRGAAFRRIASAQSGLPAYRALSLTDNRVITANDYRGIESFLAIGHIADTGWGLVVKVDTSETLAPLAKLSRSLLWATAASIGFVALINLFFLVPVVKRLKRTASAARQIMNGDLSACLMDQNNDEIAELASTINSLARDLDADQKKRSQVEEQLRYQAAHDELTGLLNRKRANEIIRDLSQNLEREHSVMFLDLNGFKDVNDLYGHAAGDEVLQCVAQRLSSQVPEGSTFARWGGDEFVVILPDTGEHTATDCALTIHNAFDDPVISSQGKHNITCSIGLATSGPELPLDQALIEADMMMYEQKKRQHSRRSKYDMTTRGVERALLENRMEMWFQPMVRLERPGNYELFGADTSIRLRNASGAYVMPDEFMPDIKDVAVIRELDERALSLALNALRRWNLAGIVDDRFKLSITLSELTISDAAFPILLESRLSTMNILPSQIQLQLPAEPVHLSDMTTLELHDIGVQFALNGVTSEPDLLRHAASTRPCMAIVSSSFLENKSATPHLMNVCDKLQLNIMANHVENREQLEQLHALGVTLFQGDVFEKPVRAVDFVSRWGQTRLTGIGVAITQPPALRLAG